MSVFLKSDLNFKNIDLSHFCKDRDLEICAVELENETYNFIIICLYRAPSGDYENFIHLLEKALEYLQKWKRECIICGDINVDYLTESNRKDQLNSLLASFNLIYTVNFPTRIQGDSATAIDNIFIGKEKIGISQTTPILNGLSDHDAQLLSININTSSKKNN